MSKKYKLSSTIGKSHNVKPDDVLAVKSALDELGYYKKPEWGISPYPDPALFAGIKRFQSDNGLETDGVMKPDGPTEKKLAAASPSYRCTNCGAFHGGVFSSKLCSDCFEKAS
jgi:murein L,D-transpeptidase YcbB/YkuD